MLSRDDIIRMAEQAGAHHLANVPGFTEFLARFAALAYEAGAAAERTRACRIVTGLCISDNNAGEICQAIRSKE